MKICLLTEGSYPYIVGGVSSWVQMLIEGFPEHEFVLYSIGAEQKDRGQFRYKRPKNLTAIQEVFLDEILALRSPGMRMHTLQAEEKECLQELVTGGKPIRLNELIQIFRGQKKRDPLEIFMSADFFDVIKMVYKERYSHLPFTDFFWTIRSMLLPLFYLLQQDLPEADVYHSVATGYCGALGGIAAEVYRKPFLITEHGIYSREREAEIIRCQWAKGDFKSVWIQYFYNLARLAYDKADQVLTLFEKNAQTEIELGCDPAKIQIIPNGIHMERFQHIPELQVHDGPVCIGAVVRVVPIKDIITMLRAFFLVKQSLHDAKLYIMGQYEEDPEYYALCQQTVEILQLKDVEFTGSVNVAEYLGKMDILLLTSISEGQPLAVLEGQGAHRPFVTTDVGCCRELIYGRSDDSLGPAGAVVAPMDYESMAKEILRLARNPELRRRMGNTGFERVRSGYTYESFIDAYREIYRQQEKGGC